MTRFPLVLCFAAVVPVCAGCAAGQGGVGAVAPGVAAGSATPAKGGTAPTPQSRALYLRLVQALEAQSKHYAALAYLDDYDAKYPHDPRAMLLRAAALLAVGRLDAAEKSYRGLLDGALAPDADDGLGRVAAARGDWAAARDHFRRATAARPTDAKFLNNYSYAALKLGDLAAAEFSLHQAAELAPANDEIRDNLILCLHLEGKSAEAEALIAAKPADRRQAIETALAQWLPSAPGGTRHKEAP